MTHFNVVEADAAYTHNVLSMPFAGNETDYFDQIRDNAGCNINNDFENIFESDENF